MNGRRAEDRPSSGSSGHVYSTPTATSVVLTSSISGDGKAGILVEFKSTACMYGSQTTFKSLSCVSKVTAIGIEIVLVCQIAFGQSTGFPITLRNRKIIFLTSQMTLVKVVNIKVNNYFKYVPLRQI
ncbi:hypothetical protein EGR_08182 [Echinococcus granulosus]|uniref:Uncharacterized protein n=1 Tax=Echinococcus granulosus TaxID=6210 RepID=W6U6Y8_ECHGR|nr:hypothetical protein EGR_08182 [Echinococcus granulosus]EUB56945.1 hypothetical protein EGR_08182 [Echinococcus granulosus]